MLLYSIPFYNALLRKELFTEKEKTKFATYSHVLVYGAISIHSQGSLGCIASNDTMAKELGMSAGTVANAISDLHKAGWVKVFMKSASVRQSIQPLLGICVLNGSSASLDSESASLGDETASFYDEPRIIVGLNALHSTMNIDNNINNIQDNNINNNKEYNNWQAVVFEFYKNISPSTPPSSIFRKTTKPAALHLLSLHPEELIKRKISALASNPQERKYITRFEVFCNKFDSLPEFSKISIPVTYVDARPKQQISNELEPDF